MAKRLMTAAAAVLLACAAFADPSMWKWQTLTVPAAAAGSTNALAGAGAQIEEVRATGLSNATNFMGCSVYVLAACDGWTQTVANVTYTNTTQTAKYTNAQWRVSGTNFFRTKPGDRVITTAYGAVTNGTITVGYLYYE